MVVDMERLDALFVWIALLVTTRTGHDHVATLGPDPKRPTGDEISIAGITTEPPQLSRKPKSVPFCDATSSSDIPLGAVDIAISGRFLGELR